MTQRTLRRKLKLLLSCPGVDTTEQSTGKTFRELIESLLSK